MRSIDLMELLYSFIDIILLIEYQSLFFKKRYGELKNLIIIIIGSIILNIVTIFFSNTSTIIAFIICCIVSCIYYQGEAKKILFHTLIFYLLYGIYTMLSLNIFALITQTDINHIFLDHSNRLNYILITRIPIILILLYVKKYRYYKQYIYSKRLNIISLFILMMILFISFYFEYLLGLKKSISNNDLIILSLLLLIIIMLIFKFVFDSIYLELENNDMKSKMEINKLKQESYLIKVQKEKEIRAIKHDLKNIILALEYLISSEKIEEAKEYVNKLVTIPEIQTNQICSNDIANALFNIKINSNKNIKFNLDLDVNDIQIEDIHLTSLLGNILDNAIEATNNVKDKEKIIWIKMKQEKLLFYLSVKNYYDGEFKKKNGMFETIKMNKDEHGFGLKNIKRIVQKYNGEMNLDSKDGIFTIEISIYFD